MKVQGVQKSLGRFDDEEAAARAYDKAAIEHVFLDRLNFDDYDLPSASLTPQREHIGRFRGVTWHKKVSKWQVVMQVLGVQKYIGCFEDEEAAARAYDKAAIEHGLLHRLNFDDYELPETASFSPAPQREIRQCQGVSWLGQECQKMESTFANVCRSFTGTLTTRRLRHGPTIRLPSSEAYWTSSTLMTMSFLTQC
jgi:hypothetical protein